MHFTSIINTLHVLACSQRDAIIEWTHGTFVVRMRNSSSEKIVGKKMRNASRNPRWKSEKKNLTAWRCKMYRMKSSEKRRRGCKFLQFLEKWNAENQLAAFRRNFHNWTLIFDSFQRAHVMISSEKSEKCPQPQCK